MRSVSTFFNFGRNAIVHAEQDLHGLDKHQLIASPFFETANLLEYKTDYKIELEIKLLKIVDLYL